MSVFFVFWVSDNLDLADVFQGCLQFVECRIINKLKPNSQWKDLKRKTKLVSAGHCWMKLAMYILS
jgi:hypothetical protein